MCIHKWLHYLVLLLPHLLEQQKFYKIQSSCKRRPVVIPYLFINEHPRHLHHWKQLFHVTKKNQYWHKFYCIVLQAFLYLRTNWYIIFSFVWILINVCWEQKRHFFIHCVLPVITIIESPILWNRIQHWNRPRVVGNSNNAGNVVKYEKNTHPGGYNWIQGGY